MRQSKSSEERVSTAHAELTSPSGEPGRDWWLPLARRSKRTPQRRLLPRKKTGGVHLGGAGHQLSRRASEKSPCGKQAPGSSMRPLITGNWINQCRERLSLRLNLFLSLY